MTLDIVQYFMLKIAILPERLKFWKYCGFLPEVVARYLRSPRLLLVESSLDYTHPAAIMSPCTRFTVSWGDLLCRVVVSFSAKLTGIFLLF
jgi:hypothetical protein